MKKLLLTFVALIGGCVLFLLSPSNGTYSYFTDTKTIPINLNLNMLSVKTEDNNILTSKLDETSYSNLKTAISSDFTGNIKISIAPSTNQSWTEYFEIELPNETSIHNSQGITSVKVTKKKNLPTNLNGKVILNLNTAIQMSDKSWKTMSTSTFTINDITDNSQIWPIDYPEKQEYFIAKDLFYTVDKNNTFKNVLPSIIYFKSTKQSTDIENKLKNAKFYMEVSNKQDYKIDLTPAVEYIKNQGYKVTLRVNPQSNYLSNEALLSFYINIKSENEVFSTGGIFWAKYDNKRYVHPLLLSSDDRMKALGSDIYTNMDALTIDLITQQDGGNNYGNNYEVQIPELGNDVEWILDDPEHNFDLKVNSFKNLTIKQRNNISDKIATLKLISTSDKTVLLERKVISTSSDGWKKLDAPSKETSLFKDDKLTIQYKLSNYKLYDAHHAEFQIDFKLVSTDGTPVNSKKRVFPVVTPYDNHFKVIKFNYSADGLYTFNTIKIEAPGYETIDTVNPQFTFNVFNVPDKSEKDQSRTAITYNQLIDWQEVFSTKKTLTHTSTTSASSDTRDSIETPSKTPERPVSSSSTKGMTTTSTNQTEKKETTTTKSTNTSSVETVAEGMN